MSNSIPTLNTVGRISALSGRTVAAVEHLIDARKVEPIGKAGNARVFSDGDVEYLLAEFRRIDRDRESSYR